MQTPQTATLRSLAWTTAALIAVALSAQSSAQAPATDIAIVSIEAGRVAPGSFRRVTDRASYDNQPSFLPDGSLVFTSMTDDQSTNIRHFSPDTGTTRDLITTPESEYSATAVPGRDAVSVIRDYGNLKQQLWSYPVPGRGEPSLLLDDVNPVGYHAWIDTDRLLLFVLGEPPTLQVATVGPGPGKVIAQNPGRSLARIPGSSKMSFVLKESESAWTLTSFDPESGGLESIVRMPEGSEDLAWAPDGSAWTGTEANLWTYRPGGKAWEKVADLSDLGVSEITRLAFSPDGKSLALVFNR